MGRPGNFDVARPHDSSSVFDTGMPKDVSPYQPRVAVSVSIQPKSVFKPKRMQRQAKQVNGAKWGQTALKSIFGGEENVITNYMAQRLLGIVEGSKADDRMTQSMQSVGQGNLMDFRDKNVASTVTSESIQSQQSDKSMVDRAVIPTPGELADFTDLSFGEGAMNINQAAPPPPPPPGDADVMDVVGEVETQPNEAATQGGLMIPVPPPPPPILQQTDAGLFTVTQRDRTVSAVDKFLNPFAPKKKPNTLLDEINSGVQLKKVQREVNPVVQSSGSSLLSEIKGGVKLKKVSQANPVQKKVEKAVDPMMAALGAAMAKRRQAVDSNSNDSGEWL
jgi:hypothetical protein